MKLFSDDFDLGRVGLLHREFTLGLEKESLFDRPIRLITLFTVLALRVNNYRYTSLVKIIFGSFKTSPLAAIDRTQQRIIF